MCNFPHLLLTSSLSLSFLLTILPKLSSFLLFSLSPCLTSPCFLHCSFPCIYFTPTFFFSSLPFHLYTYLTSPIFFRLPFLSSSSFSFFLILFLPLSFFFSFLSSVYISYLVLLLFTFTFISFVFTLYLGCSSTSLSTISPYLFSFSLLPFLLSFPLLSPFLTPSVLSFLFLTLLFISIRVHHSYYTLHTSTLFFFARIILSLLFLAPLYLGYW